MPIKKVIDTSDWTLEQFAEMEGAEIEEFCRDLLSLHQHRGYSVSEEFDKAIENEIAAQLARFKTEASIIEREVEIPAKIRKEIEFEWL